MSERPFRRRITLAGRSGRYQGNVQDHIHDFALEIEEREGVVAAITSHATRTPWSVCPGAGLVLSEFVGAPVGVRPRPKDASAHCTHLLDLAVLLVRFAGLDLPRRQFEVTVAGWAVPPTIGRVERDDGIGLDWVVEDGKILSPAEFAGRALGSSFTSWSTSALEPDVAELAMVLRRAIVMSPSRGVQLDDFDRLSETRLQPGTCFASKPERILVALRNRRSSVDSIDSP